MTTNVRIMIIVSNNNNYNNNSSSNDNNKTLIVTVGQNNELKESALTGFKNALNQT